MEYIKNIQELMLLNGETVEVSIGFSQLARVQKDNKSDVELTGKIIMNGLKNPLDELPRFMWVAYACANPEPEYTKNEFIELLPFDVGQLIITANQLTEAKKK